MVATSQRDLVGEYFAGFNAGDHPRILACLTEDVQWIIHGNRTTHGKVEFDSEIQTPEFSGLPVLTVDHSYEDGAVVVATGIGRSTLVGMGPFRFAFSDVFFFEDGLIARVESYVVPLP